MTTLYLCLVLFFAATSFAAPNEEPQPSAATSFAAQNEEPQPSVATSVAPPNEEPQPSPAPLVEPLATKLDVDKVDLNTITCPTIRCAPTGPPICAKRKGKLVLFPTNCALISFNCVTGKNWKEVELKECAKDICPVECNATEKFKVCAKYKKKSKKFSSECKFRNYACKNYREAWSRKEC